MDAIDNLIFATLNSPISPFPTGRITSDYLPLPFGPFAPVTITPPGAFTPVYAFSIPDKRTYISFQDYSIIERAMVRHWHDVDAAGTYVWPASSLTLSDFTQSPNYHLIYAYLLENTRILQIFERVIEKYVMDEELGVAQIPEVFQWIVNSEKLFFKDENTRSSNVRSLIRPSYDANRRNAYFRMFGIDLAFGDIGSGSGGTIQYYKANTANQQFIPLFERYLSEIWQGYTNARNTSGQNSSDVNNVVELAIQLQELLAARRGGRPGGPNVYATRNLSYEEFSSVMLLSWFTFIISDNTPVVQFLNCQSSTIGERLIKIGNKVGIQAHTKCQAMFEMAGAAANILNLLEAGGYLDNNGNVQTMLSSLNPPVTLTLDSDYMNAFLTVINNWEKATGHKIKNPEANITGTVKVQQNGTTTVPVVKPKPVLN